ncbi:MAG: hypothetical protein F4226_01625 [Synechococcus sp. SB0678_bin_12]|nr:hypothetical protein [Synechococcus sp. SB0678_bin_12]MYI87223.1 hypothetical protein [Synechococcus sp. SB0672_bin_10]
MTRCEFDGNPWGRGKQFRVARGGRSVLTTASNRGGCSVSDDTRAGDQVLCGSGLNGSSGAWRHLQGRLLSTGRRHT